MRKTVLCAALLVMCGLLTAGEVFEGAEKCKTCHSAAAKGSPYGVWSKEKHHLAFETLGTPEAKKIAEAKGIADPQKADACLKCHVTAFGAPDTEKGKKFNPALGIQCESCHGAGGKHVAARLKDEDEDEAAAKVKQIGAGEINHIPGEAVCIKCHNKESPNYKEFDYNKFVKEIQHIDPRRNHPADWIEKLPKEGSAK